MPSTERLRWPRQLRLLSRKPFKKLRDCSNRLKLRGKSKPDGTKRKLTD